MTAYISLGLIRAGLFTATSPSPFTSGRLRQLHRVRFCRNVLRHIASLRASPTGFGRKAAFTYSLVWYSICTLVMAFMPNGPAIDAWRFLAGMGIGVQLVTSDAYVSEIVPKEQRGRWIAFTQVIGYSGDSRGRAPCIPARAAHLRRIGRLASRRIDRFARRRRSSGLCAPDCPIRHAGGKRAVSIGNWFWRRYVSIRSAVIRAASLGHSFEDFDLHDPRAVSLRGIHDCRRLVTEHRAQVCERSPARSRSRRWQDRRRTDRSYRSQGRQPGGQRRHQRADPLPLARDALAGPPDHIRRHQIVLDQIDQRSQDQRRLQRNRFSVLAASSRLG